MKETNEGKFLIETDFLDTHAHISYQPIKTRV